jgi:hypothetical protein
VVAHLLQGDGALLRGHFRTLLGPESGVQLRGVLHAAVQVAL